MIALMIIGLCIAYVLVAAQTSRYLVGHWKYNKWINGSQHYEFEKYEPIDYGEVVAFHFVLCLCALPIGLLMAGGYKRHGGWAIAPKQHRKEQELRAAKARIAELERENLC